MKKLLEYVFRHMVYCKQKKSCNWITIIEFTTKINVKGKFHGKQWSHRNHAKTRSCGLFINCTGAMNRKHVWIKHKKSRKTDLELSQRSKGTGCGTCYQQGSPPQDLG
jgi:hypothetical protein